MTVKQKSRFVPRLESLEVRAVPAGFDNRIIARIDAEGDLLINTQGTWSSDTVVVSDAASHWRVDINQDDSRFFHKSLVRSGNIECYLADGSDRFWNYTSLKADVEGGSGNDTLVGGLNDDGLDGGSGVDTLVGWVGNDYLYGGTETDYLYGGTTDNAPFVGSDDDTLNGYVGNDYLYGGYGNDVLLGSNGNDYLQGWYGDDQLFGETDVDTLVGWEGNDYLHGGSETDYLYGSNEINQFFSFDNDTLDGYVGNDYLYGGYGNDQLLGSHGNDYLNGQDGDDHLYGESGVDTLVGWAGNDYLHGGTETDYLYGSNEINQFFSFDNDTLDGYVGNDYLYGGYGNDQLLGSHGNDYLYGQAGDDQLYGEGDNDYLNGGDHNDSLYGGAGNDTLYGGTGHDSLVTIDAGTGDYADGGDGRDTIWRDLNEPAYGEKIQNVSAFANGADRTLDGDAIADPTDGANYKNFRNNALFSSAGPSVADIDQNALADCWLLAPLGALAHANPEAVRSMVADFGDGTYGVRLGNNFYRIDADLPTWSVTSTTLSNAGLGQGGSLWVALVEKAYAWYRTGANTYASLEWGFTTDALMAYNLTSVGSLNFPRGSNATVLANTVFTHWSAQRPCTISTGLVAPGLVARHDYSVTSVSRDSRGNVTSITLRNPWGSDSGNEYLTLTPTALAACDIRVSFGTSN